jgi:hypothetical protein
MGSYGSVRFTLLHLDLAGHVMRNPILYSRSMQG